MSSYSICLGNWNMLKIKRNYFRIFFGEHPIEKLEITEVQKFRSSFPVPARPDQMNAPGEFYIFKSRYDSRYRLTASQYQYKTILSKRIFGGKSEQRLQICIGLMRLQLGKPFLEIPSGTRGPDLSMTTAVSHLDASDLQKFLLPITLRALL